MVSGMETEASRTLAVHYPWHASVWDHLAGLLQADRLPHAILLSGVGGIGKFRFGQALAQSILCESPRQTLACGQCRYCQLNAAGSHPDFKMLVPDEGAKQIKIDQVREAAHFLSQTSQQGGFKVALIAPAEAMNLNATNALLKTLEEPTDRTVLILVTESLGSLLATVRSRCQVFPMEAPGLDQTKSWLQSVIGERKDTDELLKFAAGRPLKALQIHESGELETLKGMESDLQALLTGRTNAIRLSEQWGQRDIESILAWLSSQLSSLIKLKMLGSSSSVWQPVLVGLNLSKAYTLYDKILESLVQFKRGHNPNKQLLLEDLLLDISRISGLNSL